MKLGKRCGSKCVCVWHLHAQSREGQRKNTQAYVGCLVHSKSLAITRAKFHRSRQRLDDRDRSRDVTAIAASMCACVRESERHGFRTLDGVVRECVLVVQRERLSEIWGKFPARIRSAGRLRVKGLLCWWWCTLGLSPGFGSTDRGVLASFGGKAC